MTIPNVTMRWCAKKSTCKWCGLSIEKGTPVISIFFWNKGNPDSRKWNTNYSYHPQCYIDQGMDYLNRNPYVSSYKGRRPVLSEEDRRKRFLLIRKFHALDQRRRNCNHSFPDSILTDIRLTEQMVEIMLELATVGGVPEAWAEKL